MGQSFRPVERYQAYADAALAAMSARPNERFARCLMNSTALVDRSAPGVPRPPTLNPYPLTTMRGRSRATGRMRPACAETSTTTSTSL